MKEDLKDNEHEIIAYSQFCKLMQTDFREVTIPKVQYVKLNSMVWYRLLFKTMQILFKYRSQSFKLLICYHETLVPDYRCTTCVNMVDFMS